MPKLRYPQPSTLRLSRESINVLDEIAEELGGISRRAAVELLTRLFKNAKDAKGTTYASLLLRDEAPEPVGAL